MYRLLSESVLYSTYKILPLFTIEACAGNVIVRCVLVVIYNNSGRYSLKVDFITCSKSDRDVVHNDNIRK